MQRHLRGYYNLISYAKARVLKDPLSEKHHIIPKSFGGSNKQDNIVLLTMKEHYIAHYLLTKFTQGRLKQKAWLAFKSFQMGNRIVSTRLFESNRNAMRSALIGKNNGMFGKTHSTKSKADMSRNKKGKMMGNMNSNHFDNQTPEKQAKILKHKAMNKLVTTANKLTNNIPSIKSAINKSKGLSGIKNGRAKEFILKSPTGTEYKINLLSELRLFCQDHNLVYNVVYKYRNNQMIPGPSIRDTKYRNDGIYKFQRDLTTGWIIKNNIIRKL